LSRLIRPLFDGALDIVGDVHGEYEALRALCARLGYDAAGRHPAGRHLVFVGDLCDRGPDSPGVMLWARALVESGRAQWVLGNHELALLLGQRKAGNHWFHAEQLERDAVYHPFAVLSDAAERHALREFLATLPLALERPDLRVVHAAWHAPSIDACRSIHGCARDAYRHYEMSCARGAEAQQLKRSYDAVTASLGEKLYDPDARFDADDALTLGRWDVHYQMSNPVRVLTSGPEVDTLAPLYANGKWRFAERLPWWPDYHEPVPVVFGHYWRRWNPRVAGPLYRGDDLMIVEPLLDPFMPAQDKTFCVDLSVGARFLERRDGRAGPWRSRLAALRWPEREVLFDDLDPVSV
jgi:hypothetical protein